MRHYEKQKKEQTRYVKKSSRRWRRGKKNTIYQRVSKKYEKQIEKLQYKSSKNFRGRK